MNQPTHNITHGAFRPNLFSRMLATVKNWRNRHKAIRELNAMSDALLADIGIQRHQIKDAVNNRVARSEIINLPEANIPRARAVQKAA